MSAELRRNTGCGSMLTKALLSVVGLMLCLPALSFPEKPVRIVVPYSAGGNADVIGRAVGLRLTEKWQQQVVVDNRPGGSAIIGSSIVAKAAPDGHTLLLTGTSHTTNPSLHKNLPYDTLRDFTPVTLFATSPLLLLIHRSVPARTVKELIALARKTPGGLNYASAGHGGGSHLAAELFRTATGAPVVHIPFKGATPALTELMTGNVQMMFGTLVTALPSTKDGKRLLALAVTSKQRSPLAPEIPTIEESGVAGYEAISWYGLFAPGGTPKPIVQQISASVGEILRSNLREQLEREGAIVVANNPAVFERWIQQEIAKWRNVIRKSGITAE